MKRCLRPTVLTVLILLAATTRAAVFQRDLVPGSGDGLLTYDDVNQREWLDVPVTLLSEYPGGLDGVIADLEPNGALRDFTWATRDDVFALAESAGIDTGTMGLETNRDPATNLLELLGPTTTFVTFTRLWATVDVTANAEHLDPYIQIGQFTNSAGIQSFSSFGSHDNPAAVTGVMLFRQVPEPSSLALILTSLWLICRRSCSLAASTNR